MFAGFCAGGDGGRGCLCFLDTTCNFAFMLRIYEIKITNSVAASTPFPRVGTRALLAPSLCLTTPTPSPDRRPAEASTKKAAKAKGPHAHLAITSRAEQAKEKESNTLGARCA